MPNFAKKIVNYMKDVSPGSLSLLVATIFTFGFLTLCWLFTVLWIPGRWYIYTVAGIFVFIGIYFIIKRLIKNFFFHKIKPIYRIIRKAKNSDLELKEDLVKEKPLDTIYREVDEWMKNQAVEINKLKANEKFRKEFLGNVSHELKTPIFNIQGYLLSLLEGGMEDPEISNKFLKKAEKNTDRMIQVVNDLEYISKVESGDLQLEIDAFDITKLVDEVFDFHEMRSREKDIKLRYVRRPDRSIMVRADRKRIMDVLNNLILNAIIYSNMGGYVMIDFLDMDRQLLIEVADNGLGIPEEHQNRIFERFYRVDRSRSREQGGTGLGLAIVKHVVEAHGQSINLRSTVGIGSSFTFTLDKA